MKYLIYIVILLSFSAQAQIINTVAGNGSNIFTTGVAATASGMTYVTRMAFDNIGNYYIPGWGMNQILKVDTSGIITCVAGTGIAGYNGDNILATSAQINNETTCVAVDSANNIYIADIANHRIRKIDAITGIITTVAGNGTAGYSGDSGLATVATIYSPSYIAFDHNWNLYFSDAYISVIRKINALTGIITTVVGNGNYGFSGDSGLAINAQLYDPVGICFDNIGNLYVVDNSNERVRKVSTTTGIITTIAGNGISGYNSDGIPAINSELHFPMDVTADAIGNIYIADRGNDRIRKVDTSGIIHTIAGTGIVGFSGDGGLSINAEIDNAEGVNFDAHGNLYVADFQNNRIRKIIFSFRITPSPSATVSTGTSVTFTVGNVNDIPSPTYQWLVNGANVGSGGTTYTYTPNNHDSVRCVLTTPMGGYLSSNTVIMSVGEGVATTPAANAVKIYPNPAKEIVNIEVNNQTDYRITDIQGAEKQRGVLCKGANTVSLQGLASGVYVLELVLENETKIIKIIKE